MKPRKPSSRRRARWRAAPENKALQYPAAGGRGVRAAGADAASSRRRRGRGRRRIDRGGPCRPVQARTRSHGEPVRDQPARVGRERRTASRRARREAEGACASPGAGARAAATDGRTGQSPRNSADLQRALADQAQEAARQLERLSREQNRPDLREAARRCRRPPTRCGARRPAAIPARPARRPPRPSGCAKRSASCRARRALAPNAK